MSNFTRNQNRRGRRVNRRRRNRPPVGDLDTPFIQGARSVQSIGRELSNIKRLLNVEEKNIDFTMTYPSIVAGGPVIVPLNLVGQGDTAQDRNGNSIKILRSHLRLFLNVPSTVTPAVFVRVLIVRDKQCNGALPSITDILSANLVESFRNVNTEQRFIFLHDETYGLSSLSGSQFFELAIMPQPYHVEFKGTGNLITDISTNSLLAVIVSSSVSTPTSPVVTVSTRTRFLDN
jgi:hypothetical protein